LQANFRRVDIVARWGGEEFVVALSGAAAEGAQVAAERLRAAVAELDVVQPSGVAVKVTISLGLAAHRVGESLDSVVDRADRAMYAAKTMGRNRVVIDTTAAEPAGIADDTPEDDSLGPTEFESGRWKVGAQLS
jgi:diguanylate cyclase (GGDEF)-like protein